MATGNLQPLQGMADLAPPEIALWHHVEEASRRVFRLYGFEEVRTPILERTAVFSRALGEGAEVVQKEMYTFEDRGGRQLSMRPEGTAGVIRYVGAAGGPEQIGGRLYYIGPMFRCERPQAGRKRQFHQLGVESIGGPSPAADAECIALQMHLLAAIGIEGCTIHLNTRGLPEDRPAVRAGLVEGLAPHREALCEDCRRRLEEHPLRVLDCKKESCRALVGTLPPVTAFMSEASRTYLVEVERLLVKMEIPVVVNPTLVRGLDYYMHTVWEVTHDALGAQDALAGGGRYRIDMEGRACDGVGFAMGIERLLMALQSTGVRADQFAQPLAAWIVTAGASAAEENLLLLQTLRQRGVSCGMDLSGRSVKAQMRAAHRAGVSRVILRGDDELARGLFVLKDMQAGTQEEIALPELLARAPSWMITVPGT